jgi:hypothetical protein
VKSFKERMNRMAYRNVWQRGYAGATVRFVLLAVLGPGLIHAQQLAPVMASFAHIAFGGVHSASYSDTWTTEFVFTNLGTSPASLTLRWFGDSGRPLTVPVIGGTRNTSHQFQIAANSSLDIQLDNSSDGLTEGWVAVDILGSVDGQAIYHSDVTGRPEYTAAAPMMHHGTLSSFILLASGVPVSTMPAPRSVGLPFNTLNHATGVAFANVTAAAQVLTINYLDNSGTLLAAQSIPIGPGGHVAFAVSDPRLAGNQGTIRVVGDASPFSAIAFVMGTGTASGTFSTFLPAVQ